MPYKFETDKLKIKKEDDNRRKLTDDERLEISRLYGKISQRKLAKMFSVSRRTIVFIGCPEKHKQNLECRAARGGSKQYYDTEKNTIAIQKCRLHKKDLNKKSKLKVEKMNEGKELDCVYGSEHQKTTLFCYKGWYVCSGTLRVHKTNDHIYTGVDIEELKGIDVFTMCNPILSIIKW